MLLSHDLPIVLTLLGAGITAILAGSLLLPRGQIMISEAASHAVLPGMVLGFALSGQHGGVMIAGSVFAIGPFMILAGWLRGRHRLGSSVEVAALFPIFFSLGVIALSLTGLEDTAAIDLDHVLFGSLELILWLDVFGPADLLRPAAWRTAPEPMLQALGGAALALMLVLAAYPLINRSLMDGSSSALMTPIRHWFVRGLEIIVIATASAVCLRTAGVVVAIALFGAPVIGGWCLARNLWQVWLAALGIIILALGLSYSANTVLLEVFGIEARLSGVLALCLVIVATLLPITVRRDRSRRPLP